MAKKNDNQPSQLEIIESVMAEKYKDTGGYLIEKDVAKKVDMRRKIVAHQGIKYVLYKLDQKQGDLFPFFSDRSGLKRFCDYLLFAEEPGVLYVMAIELKNSKGHAISQLQAAECFVDYITCAAKRIRLPLTYEVQTIKIKIIEKPAGKITKGTTKVKPLSIDKNDIVDYTRTDAFRLKEVIATLLS